MRNQEPTIRRISAPPIDLQVIKWLRLIFTDRPMHPDKVTTDALWHRQGALSVIDRMQNEYDDQQRTTLEETKT